MSDVVAALTTFARALRAAGVGADSDRLRAAVSALSYLDVEPVENVYWATRLTLCAEPDDLPVFDALFDTCFRGRLASVPGPGGSAVPSRTVRLLPLAAGSAEEDEDERGELLRTAASEQELLRHCDIAALSPAEREEINRLIALLGPRVGRRRSLRRAPAGRGRIDVSRTVRTMLRDGGEPGEIAYSRRRERPRRLVLLLDVSGSMAPYSDALLRFAHAAARVAPATTEVFTISTRLTRVTVQLRHRDPEQALRTAGTAVPDWSGGTRLGDSLRAFLDRWGQRGTARGAVVVIVSDGWERGGAALLGEQMERLARLAYRVVWVNPHRGKPGFEPATAGMRVALPHIDELVAGHSFESLRELADAIRRP